MDMRIPPLKIKILLEPNPPRSRILVRRLAVSPQGPAPTRLAQITINYLNIAYVLLCVKTI